MPQATLSASLSFYEYQGMEEANWLLKVLSFLFSARFTFSRIMFLNFSYSFSLWGKGVRHIILPAIKVLSKKKKRALIVKVTGSDSLWEKPLQTCICSFLKEVIGSSLQSLL